MQPTHNTLSGNIRAQSVELLNKHLAAAIDLHAQVKQAHWNVRGPGFFAIHPGITSPAMPPNTVELATPLPPSRLAPCMPLASSPATNRPKQSVVVSTSQITPPMK